MQAPLDLRASRLTDETSLEPLLDQIGNARFVLLGEATHGTHEFYTWRTAISRRLIEERGFTFIAVEGDWPDCYRVNRYIKGFADSGISAREVLGTFDRWPTWMWANDEVAELAEWMKRHNAGRDESDRVGFYGLDVYSLWDSMREVVAYLQQVDPEAARQARNAYACFDRFHEDEQAYARATVLVPTSCEDEAVRILREMQRRAQYHDGDGSDSRFSAEQNALVAANAERYYRAMVRGGSTSWNVRDHHMVETLERLVAHHGPNAKAIIWEHNTHIGDARYTDMRRSGMVNVGQLVRQLHGEGPEDGEGVVLVGFGTHHGTVLAGDEWGAPMRVMQVPAARAETWEGMLHDLDGGRDLLLCFDEKSREIPALRAPIEHRAIGVVYTPAFERYGNWVPTIVPRRYDAFFFLDETRALDALELRASKEEMETYPSGM